MLFTHFMLASLAVGTAVSIDHFYAADAQVFGKRQAPYKPPPPTYCTGSGTCEAACGPGYISCGNLLCYNPANADTCCEPGSSASWSCTNGDYCLVKGYCCPRGLDPKACALSKSFTLPATYVGPTATSGVISSSSGSGVPSVTSAGTTRSSTPSSTSVRSFSTSAASTSVAAFTGAASSNTFTGRTGLIYGVLALIGNLF